MDISNIKILVFTVSSWNSKVGANSWATLLKQYKSENIANICIRDEIPDSDVCGRYFTISENRIVKSLLNRKIKTGYEVSAVKNFDNTNDQDFHNKVYNKYQNKRNYPLLLARELIWKFGKWKTKELNAFLDDFKPDIILHSMEGYIHMNRIIDYSINRTGAKSIGYIWDDNFTYKVSKNFGFRFYRFFQRRSLVSLAKKTDEFFAISPKTKNEADEFFGVNSTIITKPLNEIPKYQETKFLLPLKMLYTGSLIIGRYESLKSLVGVLDRINKEQVNFELSVYTGTYLNEEELKEINRPYCHVNAAIPQGEVIKKQKQADILIFLEAIQGESADSARLSFSTKITDYLSAGKPILAVGKKDISPIEYFDDNLAAVVAHNEEEMYSKLLEILGNIELLNVYAKSACETGIEKHDPDKILDIFNNVLQNVIDRLYHCN